MSYRHVRIEKLLTCLHRPREAAVTIVHYVNHRNQNVSLLALNVRYITRIIARIAYRLIATRHLCQELRIPLPPSDQHKGVPQRAGPPLSRTSARPRNPGAE